MSAHNHEFMALLQTVSAAIRDHAEEVAALDQAIGDGDHVANLQRGLETLQRAAADWEAMDWSELLQKSGMSLMSSIGGASGSLYGTLFMAMGKALKEREGSAGYLAYGFSRGVEAMKQRGKADVGDKTMLDVLVPVAQAWSTAVESQSPPASTLQAITEAARAGCESTRDLVAGKGRASFLGERARGYLDPGARTSQLMIEAVVRHLQGNA
jgi:dihydroxyacetone kinase-like protein